MGVGLLVDGVVILGIIGIVGDLLVDGVEGGLIVDGGGGSGGAISGAGF
jgi:hypothetical protein